MIIIKSNSQSKSMYTNIVKEALDLETVRVSDLQGEIQCVTFKYKGCYVELGLKTLAKIELEDSHIKRLQIIKQVADRYVDIEKSHIEPIKKTETKKTEPKKEYNLGHKMLYGNSKATKKDKKDMIWLTILIFGIAYLMGHLF